MAILCEEPWVRKGQPDPVRCILGIGPLHLVRPQANPRAPAYIRYVSLKLFSKPCLYISQRCSPVACWGLDRPRIRSESPSPLTPSLAYSDEC